MANSNLTFDTGRVNSVDSIKSLSNAVGWLIGFPPRENVSNCWVSDCARRSDFSEFSSRWKALSLGVRFIFARVKFPITAVRILLKSWAIPPARTPMNDDPSDTPGRAPSGGERLLEESPGELLRP